MSKKDFIALADAIRLGDIQFTPAHLRVLVDFCRSQNSAFKTDRWLSYVAGECGPNGGTIKVKGGAR